MYPVVPLVISAATVAGAALRVIECWIRSRHQARLAREYDRAVLSALPQLPPGYGLEHRAPDGSQWVIRLSSPARPGKEVMR